MMLVIFDLNYSQVNKTSDLIIANPEGPRTPANDSVGVYFASLDVDYKLAWNRQPLNETNNI